MFYWPNLFCAFLNVSPLRKNDHSINRISISKATKGSSEQASILGLIFHYALQGIKIGDDVRKFNLPYRIESKIWSGDLDQRIIWLLFEEFSELVSWTCLWTSVNGFKTNSELTGRGKKIGSVFMSDHKHFFVLHTSLLSQCHEKKLFLP